MHELGYPRYIAQGGDWGATLCKVLGQQHSDSCVAIHINMPVAFPYEYNPLHLAQLGNALLPVLDRLPLLLNQREIQNVKDMMATRAKETGYQAIQGTKPQTLGYALTDSPSGLLAWILEKLHRWSDFRESLMEVFTKDDILTWVSVYWFTGNITSSLRIYKEAGLGEAGAGRAHQLVSQYCKVPTGAALFPKELWKPPKAWAKAYYNIQHWTEYDKGGHFAAHEQPVLLASDIQEFVDQLVSSKKIRLDVPA
jgi:pimeloyl-ACP methyl ester carboxylesterase